MSRSGGGRATEGLAKTSKKKKSQADIKSSRIASEGISEEDLGHQCEHIVENQEEVKKGEVATNEDKNLKQKKILTIIVISQ